MCSKRTTSMTSPELEVMPTGLLFSRYCFGPVLRWVRNFPFSLQETFSLHDISKLMENDLAETLALSLSTFSTAHQVPETCAGWYLASNPWLNPHSCLAAPSSLNPVSNLQGLLHLVSEDWGKGSSEYFHAVGPLPLNHLPHSAEFTFFPCLTFYYYHSSRNLAPDTSPASAGWFLKTSGFTRAMF